MKYLLRDRKESKTRWMENRRTRYFYCILIDNHHAMELNNEETAKNATNYHRLF